MTNSEAVNRFMGSVKPYDYVTIKKGDYKGVSGTITYLGGVASVLLDDGTMRTVPIPYNHLVP